MDPSYSSETEYYTALHYDSDQLCYPSSTQELQMGSTNGTVLENIQHTHIQTDQLGSEYAELLENQPDREYTQFLVANADADVDVSDDLWPSNLTAEFIEQCVQTLDAIRVDHSDSSCLTISNDQLSLLYPSVVAVGGQDRVISLDKNEGHLPLDDLGREPDSQWPGVAGAHVTAQDAMTDSEPTELHTDPSQLDCSIQPVVSVDPSSFSSHCRPPLPSPVAVPPPPAATWSQGRRDDCQSPPLGRLVWQLEASDARPPADSLQAGHSSLHDPAQSDYQAAWSPAPVTEVEPHSAEAAGGTTGWWRPPPSAAARLAEVECELTVSEETEQEVAPPGGGPTADLAPYQEHNYDYPLEPLVAGEVRPSADHQYASRPASPGAAACSATDHRYAYSPPAALTEEDLIRSISDQLGLPQDHGYSQPRQGQSTLPAAAPAQQQQQQPPAAAGRTAEPGGPEPCRVAEPCPADLESTLDDPAGHWVDPNLVMGITTGWQRQEEVDADGDGVESTAELFDGTDAVLLDRDLWESGLAVLSEEGSKYVVLDVVEPSAEELSEAMNVASQGVGGNDREFVLDEGVQTLSTAGALGDVGSELVLPEVDPELTQLLWTVAGAVDPATVGGSSLEPSEADTVPLPAESSLVPPSCAQAESETSHVLPDSRPALPLSASTLSSEDSMPMLTALPAVGLTPAGAVSEELPYDSPAQPEVLPSLPSAPPEDVSPSAVSSDGPPFDTDGSSTLSYTSLVEVQEPQLGDTRPVPTCPEVSATAADIPPVTEPEHPQETNIVISRTAVGGGSSPPPPSAPPPSPPSRPLEADPASLVRGWLRRRAAAQQPVTRAQLSTDLAALLGPERRDRLVDSGVFLDQWLDRLTDGGGARKAAGERPARISYPPQFKLLVLRFTDFMPPDQVAAAFCVPITLVYKWRAKRRELAELATADAGCVRAKGAGKKRRLTEVDAEFSRWLERREQESDAPPSYGEVRQMAKQLYVRSGLKIPRFRLSEREHSVTNRRRDHTAIRWLLSEFEVGRSTDRAALASYGLLPGGPDWAGRLLARHPALRRPQATWQMALPDALLAQAERWAGTLTPLPPHAVTVMADVPITTRPAPCAVWKSEDSEHLATLLISCTLEGTVQPPMLILKGGGHRVYSDSSGLLTAQQESGRLDAARAGLWLQLVGCRGPAQLLLLNSCCAGPQPDQLRDQAAAADRRLAVVPPGLAAAANPLMTSRQQLSTSIAAALGDGWQQSDLLAAVRTQLVGWGDSAQLRQDLARVRRLYPAPVS